MKILDHSESHIVVLEDGTRWHIHHEDLDATLHWQPETKLSVVIDAINGDDNHVLVDEAEGTRVRASRIERSTLVNHVKHTF